MEEVAAKIGAIPVVMVLGLVFSLVAAIPVMWFFGALSYWGGIGSPLGYGQSYVVALMVCWIRALT